MLGGRDGGGQGTVVGDIGLLDVRGCGQSVE